ncbi:MAG: hypothetical protein KF860_04770 [Cyclobacteriaceae bacterium]|nr:hypothetical protein [Cyclobacteriaceae bacterium]
MKSLAIYLLAFGFLLSSCSDDNEIGTPPGPAPEIPPISTFEIDLNQLPQDNGGRVGGRTNTMDNWGHAAIGIGVWNLILGVSTVVPVAAFKASINQTPEFIGNNTWQWKYDFSVANVQHSAKLQGTLVSNGVDWKMLLSKEGAFTDYEWYSGHANAERTVGTWTLNFGPDENRPFIQIDWDRNINNTVADIKYTSIDPNAIGKGSYIYFGINEETLFNAFYQIFDKEHENMIEIEWNRSTNEGRVRNPNYFGNNEFHCWNAALEDVNC